MQPAMLVYQKGAVFSQGYQHVQSAVLPYPHRALLYFVHRVTPDAVEFFQLRGIWFYQEWMVF